MPTPAARMNPPFASSYSKYWPSLFSSKSSHHIQPGCGLAHSVILTDGGGVPPPPGVPGSPGSSGGVVVSAVAMAVKSTDSVDLLFDHPPIVATTVFRPGRSPRVNRTLAIPSSSVMARRAERDPEIGRASCRGRGGIRSCRGEEKRAEKRD